MTSSKQKKGVESLCPTLADNIKEMHVLKKLSIGLVIIITLIIVSGILGSVTFYVFIQGPVCEAREAESVNPQNVKDIYCQQYPQPADRTFARFVRMPLCGTMSLQEKYVLWRECF